jgi:hypothetical protein
MTMTTMMMGMTMTMMTTAVAAVRPRRQPPQPQRRQPLGYTDVTTTYWASSFIYRLASINVVSGFPDGGFLPNAYLTQAQYAAFGNPSL